LFKIIFDEIRVKELIFTVRWMPSHLDESDLHWLPPDISALDLKGNDFADKQADVAATAHVINLNASSHILWYANQVMRIQKRLVCIMCSLDARKKHTIEDPAKAILPKLPAIEDLFPFSSHVILHNGNAIMCARCNCSYPRKHEYVRKWLVTACPMLNSSIDRPRPMPQEIFHVGSKSIHVSHKLNIFRGLMYCRRCGCRASTSGANFIKKLAKSCQAPGTYGLDNLKRLQQGRLPYRVTKWPIDQIDDPDRDIADRIAAAPLSDFERQVVSDHPELSVGECRLVANMLLRCAEYAAQVVPRYLADNPGKNIKPVVDLAPK
jgi:hypothetical protein